MSSRKNALLPHRTVADGVMTGTATITSEVTDIMYLDNIGLQFIWTGTPTGTFFVEVSNDGETFTPLTISGLPAPAGVAGDYAGDLNQLPYRYLRVRYVNSAGVGVLNVYISAKMI